MCVCGGDTAEKEMKKTVECEQQMIKTTTPGGQGISNVPSKSAGAIVDLASVGSDSDLTHSD